MDFVKILPVELSENIFQHLTIKELLNVTLVSKSWDKFIGESSNIMKNIKLICDINNKSTLLSIWKQITSKSSRKYRNVVFKRIDVKFIRKIYYIFKSKNYQMRTLLFHDVHFNNTKEFADFIKLFKSSIKEIFLKHVEVKEIQEIECDEFEELKFLSFTSYESFDCINVFIKCKNLIMLAFKANDELVDESVMPMNSKYVEPIVKLLYQNENLKYLNVTVKMDKNHILEDKALISKIPFKLTYFLNLAWGSLHYNKFFTAQVDCIQALKLCSVDHNEDLITIFKMSNLKKVYLGKVTKLNLINIKLHVNTNFKDLGFYYVNSDKALKILNSAPNVENLEIYWITQAIIDHISVKMKLIKSLTIFEPSSHLNGLLFPAMIEPIENFLKHIKINYIKLKK